MRRVLVLLLVCWSSLIAAQSAADLLAVVDQELSPEERDAPGSTRRAEAIRELLDEDLGLAIDEARELRLALAGAWLAAGDHAQASAVAETVYVEATAIAAQRERAGLLWVAAWQDAVMLAEQPATLPAPQTVLAAIGVLPLSVHVRALTADAARWLRSDKIDEALVRYDEALGLLKDRPAAERVPLYELRLLAMERPEPDPVKIQAWLDSHAGDPALTQIVASALTAGQRMIGRLAPPLTGARRLDAEGVIDLAALRGRPVLLDFFATWCKPCDELQPVVTQIAQKYQPKGLQVVGVSLDTKDTLAQLPAYCQRHGVIWPIVGDGNGWDGEIDDYYGIDGIPALILIGADGRVAVVELVGGSAEQTTQRLSEAIERALALPNAAPPGAVAPPPPGPAMDGVIP